MQQVPVVFSEVIVNPFPEFFSKTTEMCANRLEKTNPIFHHIFRRNIFPSFLSLPPLQTMRGRREQVSLTHQPQPRAPGASPGTAGQH